MSSTFMGFLLSGQISAMEISRPAFSPYFTGQHRRHKEAKGLTKTLLPCLFSFS